MEREKPLVDVTLCTCEEAVREEASRGLTRSSEMREEVRDVRSGRETGTNCKERDCVQHTNSKSTGFGGAGCAAADPALQVPSLLSLFLSFTRPQQREVQALFSLTQRESPSLFFPGCRVLRQKMIFSLVPSTCCCCGCREGREGNGKQEEEDCGPFANEPSD